jgi:hypothetical protein
LLLLLLLQLLLLLNLLVFLLLVRLSRFKLTLLPLVDFGSYITLHVKRNLPRTSASE